MKCMICGGQTLPGAKLCLPCRAALRRARDDTISELLPLPRRRAFAFSHSPEIGRRAPLAPTARPVAERPAVTARSRRLSSAQLHAAAVVAFVAAAGVLTFYMARELQRERPTPASIQASPTADAKAVTPRVSPSTMLGTARDESHAAAEAAPPSEPETADILPPPAQAPVNVERPSRPRSVAKAAVVLDPFPAAEPVAPPVIIAAPHPPPAPAVRAAPADRAQILTASLARCTGDFFSRAGCEQRARLQYCEGQWGQIPQCPAGIANEHGQ
jgi:hypothetical protein